MCVIFTFKCISLSLCYTLSNKIFCKLSFSTFSQELKDSTNFTYQFLSE